MEDFAYFPRIFLALLLTVLMAEGVLAQTDGPLKLYVEENSRLKQQKTALATENEALKKELQSEKQKTTQLQTSLDQVEPGIIERDRQIADLKAELERANRRIAQRQLLAALLAWIIVLLLSGLLIYSQRATLGRLLRSLMEQSVARAGLAKRNTAKQSIRTTGKIEENIIKPEELAERLYGRRRV